MFGNIAHVFQSSLVIFIFIFFYISARIFFFEAGIEDKQPVSCTLSDFRNDIILRSYPPFSSLYPWVPIFDKQLQQKHPSYNACYPETYSYPSCPPDRLLGLIILYVLSHSVNHPLTNLEAELSMDLTLPSASWTALMGFHSALKLLWAPGPEVLIGGAGDEVDDCD